VSSPRLPGIATLSAYGLFAAGLLALAVLAASSRTLSPTASPAQLLTGTVPVTLQSLVVGGGLLVLGVAAVALGSVVLYARAS
jgi:hypothetical protein